MKMSIIILSFYIHVIYLKYNNHIEL